MPALARRCSLARALVFQVQRCIYTRPCRLRASAADYARRMSGLQCTCANAAPGHRSPGGAYGATLRPHASGSGNGTLMCTSASLSTVFTLRRISACASGHTGRASGGATGTMVWPSWSGSGTSKCTSASFPPPSPCAWSGPALDQHGSTSAYHVKRRSYDEERHILCPFVWEKSGWQRLLA